ncbi:hypothetical protein IQ13_4253 [Lacibacter cauensis]|uniref:Lipoprotein n=1 Tax=Lacibacter cauensis TaxID=510947 RepID=A0A562S9N8_9BACT|nr:hypothetical protein IQ13_4253 [Lacibacter cauensis]
MQKLILLIFITLLGCKRDNQVYLCNGPQSKVYHKTNHCQGLINCSTEIEATDLNAAKGKYRKACGYCYHY